MRLDRRILTAVAAAVAVHGASAAQDRARERAVQEQIQQQVHGAGGGGDLQGDPLERLIRTLDQGTPQRNEAVRLALQELSSLGALANGALHRYIDTLGPFGVATALDLLLQHPDARLPELLGRMLQSDDSGRQVLAARAMVQLGPAASKELLDRAAQSANPLVRANALRARAARGAPAAEVLAEVRTLLAARTPGIVDELAPVMAASSAMRGPEGRAFLVEVARGGDDGALQAFLQQFVSACTPGDDEMLSVMFDALPETGDARALLARAAYAWSLGQRWPALMRKGLPFLEDAIQKRNTLHELRRRGVRVPAAVLRRVWDEGDEHTREFVMDHLKDNADAANHADLLLAIVVARGEVNQRGQAHETLVRFAPERLRAATAELLRSPHLDWTMLSSLIRTADDAALDVVIQALLQPSEAMRRILHSDRDSVDGLLAQAVDERSSARNLPALLELAAARGVELNRDLRAGIAKAMQRWFAPEHVTSALPRVLEVAPELGTTIMQLSAPHVRGEHAPVLVDLARRALAMKRAIDWHELYAMLASVDDAAAVPVLLPLLEDPDETLQRAALHALLRRPAIDRKQVLERALRGTPSKDLLQVALDHAARDLAHDPALREALLAYLSGAGRRINVGVTAFLEALPPAERAAAAERLASQPDASQSILLGAAEVLVCLHAEGRDLPLELFRRLLRHDDWYVRSGAVHLLARTFARPAAALLLEALKDDQQSVRKAAQEALERFEEYFAQEEKWRRRLQEGDAGK